ncbi:hypothetical protein IPA_07330 [Ignicoccus pacificus DSM 13166]|uniref:Uncharacterized protein n=1 Tax=Ignicoccus pacificus DSM 13166 TaxID=940294 RepID=A0A977PL61_9CREN|nr:hypothetical protein IPA_07330 [Ignicoccus pacificus DSM 13166]
MDVSWGSKYIAVALGMRGFTLIDPYTGEVRKEITDNPAYAIAWSGRGKLAVGSDGYVLIYDEEGRNEKKISVPGEVSDLVWIGGGLIAGGNGWIAYLEDKKEVVNIGLNVTRLAWKRGLLAVGTAEGRLLIMEEDKIIWSVELGPSVLGLSWGPFLLAATSNGKIFKISDYEEFKPKEFIAVKGVSDLTWNPKGDEFALAENYKKAILFYSSDGAKIGEERLDSIPLAIDYSPTAVEVAVVLESGELYTLGTPKVAIVLEELIKASKCNQKGRILCQALEKAFWKLVGELGQDIPLDEFLALKNLEENIPQAVSCLLKYAKEVREAVRDILSMEDVVDALKEGCENFKKWIGVVTKNRLCVKRVSELLDDLLDLAPGELLPAQIPTSVTLVERFGCEGALKVMECAFALALILKDLKEHEDELGVKLPTLTEVILYALMKNGCDDLIAKLKQMEKLKKEAAKYAEEGELDKLMRVLDEVRNIAEELREELLSTLPEGYVGV